MHKWKKEEIKKRINMTLKETLIALAEGKKIRLDVWMPKYFIYLKGETFYNQDNEEENIYLETDSVWDLYQEPKKKVTKYLWACSSGSIHRNFSVDPITAPNPLQGDISEITYDIRLDWSATAFEVEG